MIDQEEWQETSLFGELDEPTEAKPGWRRVRFLCAKLIDVGSPLSRALFSVAGLECCDLHYFSGDDD